MNSDLTAKIEITKNENAEIIVSILNCDLSFDGSQISFDKDFVTELEGLLADAINDSRLIIGFDNPYIDRKVNIAAEGINFQLKLIGCSIKNRYPTLEIDFRGTSFSFDRCLAEMDSFEFNFKKGNFKLSNIKNGYFEINQNQIITSKRTITAFPQGVKIKSDGSCFGEFTYIPDARLQIFKGKFESIEADRGDLNLSMEQSVSISYFRIHNYEFYDLDCRSNGQIEASPYSLILRCLDSVSKIVIKNTRLTKFTCDTCDFSKTNINLSGNSSMNFKELESIATLWNPNEMIYRDFCPKTFRQKVNTGNSAAAREFFCEMKTHFSNKGDSITAGEFHCVEMIAHAAHLQNQSVFSSDRKALLLQDRFSMFISLWSSNFGQNWTLALFWYFLFSAVVVFIFWIQKEHWYCYDFIKFLADVLNPIMIDFWEIKNVMRIESWNVFIWILWKIIAGFLIYQIIISSRRFIRKW